MSLHDGRHHLGVTDLVKAYLFPGGDTQVEDATIDVRAPVIHAHHDVAAVVDAHHLQFCTEGQALVRTGVVFLVKDFYARRLLAMESGSVIARLTPNPHIPK